MSILGFDKPNKLRTTEEHNELYSTSSEIPGTYVPNMSEEDNMRWKAKHISGENQRIEIRKSFGDVQSVIIVYKNGNVHMSFNGTCKFSESDWENLKIAVDEAKNIIEG